MNLYFSMYGACLSGEYRHAQNVMKSLGLTYKDCECHPIGDCWFFFDVEGDISNLPSFIYEKHNLKRFSEYREDKPQPVKSNVVNIKRQQFESFDVDKVKISINGIEIAGFLEGSILTVGDK